MALSRPIFLDVWGDDRLRRYISSYLNTEDVCSIRLTSFICCELTTPSLFIRTRVTFTPSALTRPSRLEALSRIGRHIEHLTFYMPHTPATFLPPLLDPYTGQEVSFLYTPHTTSASVAQRPKYGTPELGDLLTQQYPPLFHAASNVPAFIKTMSQMHNLRHLTISCPDQDPAQRYRRDCVDYALISLRIAIERAPLLKLEKLSLSHIHPSGLLYLRHMPGFGCTPSAGRRWKQIRKLNITMDSWDFLGLCSGRDHLKILDDYIRSFSSNLEKVSFGWSGRRGPCPLTLFSDPLFSPPKRTAKLFAEVTSPMSPLPAHPPRAPMRFPKLRYMQIRNATMSAEQVADFITQHRHTVGEFDFENVFLINGGVWEDALAPLTRLSGADEWLSQQSGSETGSSDYLHSQDDFDHLDDIEEEVIDIGFDTPDEKTKTIQVKKKKVHRKRRRRRKEGHQKGKEKDKEKRKEKEKEKENQKGKEKEKPGKLKISNPIPINGPIEEVLMPTTFDPNIQGVQRNVQMEAAQQELADDPNKQTTTLKKAKEAVLKQLSKEFCRNQERKEHVKGFFKQSCSSQVGRKGKGLGMESTTALVPLMFSRY